MLPDNGLTTDLSPDGTDGDSSWSTSFSLAQPNVFTLDKINQRYRAKCHKIKKLMKTIVFENGALCDEVAQVQEKILIVQEERRFLLKKLLFYQGYTEPPPLPVEPKPKKKPAPKKRLLKDALEESLKVKAKRKKPNPEKKLVQAIPLDTTGRPIFPIVVGVLTIHSLGEIISDRTGFHTEDFIYPIGFCSTRTYASTKSLFHRCLYTCTVQDNGNQPRFEVMAEDDPEHPMVGASPDQCINLLYQAINTLCGRATLSSETGLGAQFFGFSHPTIHNLIQNCSGARKCTTYKWVRYEISKMALDCNLEASHPGLNHEALNSIIVSQIKESYNGQ